MKKILTFILVLVLCGCGSQVQEEESNNSNNQTTDNTTTNEITMAIDHPIEIQLQEKIELPDFLSFQIDSAEWTDEIYPSNTSGTYSYLSDSPNEKYFVLKGVVKNLSGRSIDVQFDLGMYRFLFNDKYEYTGTMTAESSKGDDFYGYDIDPLTETNFILYISVPDEVKDIYETCQVDILFGDGTNRIYDVEDVEYYYLLHLNN